MAHSSDYYQLQSPLYRLPRELRDQIYELVVSEEAGYGHDFASSTLRRFTSLPGTIPQAIGAIKFDLAYTCRIAAAEMRGIPLRTNAITFMTGLSNQDGGSYRGLQSRAGRLRCLNKYVQATRIYMVLYTAELITPEMLEKLAELYPSVSDRFSEPLRRAIPVAPRGPKWYYGAFRRYDSTDVAVSTEFDDALQYLLRAERLRDPTRFDELASKAFGRHVPPLFNAMSYRHFFAEGSLNKLLSWDPAPWAIPSDADLISLEAALTEPKSLEEIQAETRLLVLRELDCPRDSIQTRWFFSAAAVCIDFLNRLQPTQRRQIRQIILREDHKSVYRPECHVRGLIPFYKENSKLRIERHVGLWTNLFPVQWECIDNRRSGNYKYFIGRWVLMVFAWWIQETSLLKTSGLAPGAFSLVVEGTSEESIQAWDIMKHAASLQEAMTESFRRRGMPLPLHVQDRRFEREEHPLPCHLPLCFATTIRDIIQGTSMIRFDGYIGELWDTEDLIGTRQHWTVDEWRTEWEEHVLHRGHYTELFQQLRSRYRLPEDTPMSSATTTAADAATDALAEASVNTEIGQA